MSLLQKCGVDIQECDRLTCKMLFTYYWYSIDRHDIAAETSNPLHRVSRVAAIQNAQMRRYVQIRIKVNN